MRFDPGLALDFLSALALLAVLSLAYGQVRQRWAGAWPVPLGMGLSFGCVAALMMTAPLGNVAGVIVDPRAIPVALAGAYFGWRGLVGCLAVALAQRWQIGGIGLVPDAVGLALAGGAGLIWARLVRRRPKRGLPAHLALALLVSGSLVSAVLLPAPLAGWMLTRISPILVVCYLITLPLLARLLEGRQARSPPAGLGCNGRAARSYRPRERPCGAAR